MTAPWGHLVRQSDIITVNPRSILLGVWPTGGAEGSRASRLEARISRAEDVGLDGAKHLDLVVPDVHAARRGNGFIPPRIQLLFPQNGAARAHVGSARAGPRPQRERAQ